MSAPNLSWGGFANGRIPRENLVEFQPGKLLQANAASRLQQLRAAFKARWGADLYADWYQDLYRDLQRQTDMWNSRGKGFPWPDSVASPGNSIHGWARSADLTGYGASGSERHNWLVRNAPNYGWSWSYGKELGESWHFDYVGPITTMAGDGISPMDNEEDMKVIRCEQNASNWTSGDKFLVAPGFSHSIAQDSIDALGLVVQVVPDKNTMRLILRDLGIPEIRIADYDAGRDKAQETYAALRDLINDLPTNGEMGQALTSTVALVNEHADENKDEIIAAIPSGGSGGSASAYALSLDIEQVPGTATGTATPQ